MTSDLFAAVVLPVADEDDAASTSDAALPYVRAAGGRVVALNVIEKAGGAPDKAGVEQRKEHAERMFDAVRATFEGTGVDVETRVGYGTDVAETVFEVADEVGASAVVFTPRGGSRWIRLLTGDTALGLITANDRPVVVLPDAGNIDDTTETGNTGDSHDTTETDDTDDE